MRHGKDRSVGIITEKPYEIVEVILCNIQGSWCEGFPVSYHKKSSKIIPDCKNCSLYKDLKQSGLTLKEWKEKAMEEERERF